MGPATDFDPTAGMNPSDPDRAPHESASWRRQLAPGEQLVWQGRPQQGVWLHRADLWAIPFSILWGGFAIYWEWKVLTMDSPGFFVFCGIPFVLMGLYLMVGRFFMDARRRAHTRYALTTERVLIASGAKGERVRSLPLRRLGDIALDEAGDGRGTITLGDAGAAAAALGRGWATAFLPPSWPGAPRPPQLEGIEDADRVFQKIQDAQRRTT